MKVLLFVVFQFFLAVSKGDEVAVNCAACYDILAEPVVYTCGVTCTTESQSNGTSSSTSGSASSNTDSSSGSTTYTVDNSALTNRIDQLEQSLNVLQQELVRTEQRLNETRNATVYSFTAMLRTSMVVDDSTALIYDDVRINIGDGYDVTTGIFTAPGAGTYFFDSFAFGKDKGMMKIKRNDDVLCKHVLSARNFALSSCSVVAVLEVGDQVRVTGCDPNPSEATAGTGTGFTGFLIKTTWDD